jgi:hypothetical protein
MSFRARIAGAVAIAAGLTAVAPAAYATTPAPAPQPAVKLALGAPAPQGPLLPGGRAETFTVTATNTTAKPQTVAPDIAAIYQGAVPLIRSDVKVSVVGVNAPASAVAYGAQDGGVIGGIIPKGGKLFASAFILPAHHSYTWKVSVAAGASWQRNDNALRFTMYDGAAGKSGFSPKTLFFKVGTARTGGPLTVALSGATKLVLGKFENVDVTVTNRTGARLSLPLGDQLTLSAWTFAGGKVRAGSASAVIQVLENGHWVTVGKNLSLPVLPGLASGASHTFRLRIRLTGYQTQLPAGVPASAAGVTKINVDDTAWILGRGLAAGKGELLNIASS